MRSAFKVVRVGDFAIARVEGSLLLCSKSKFAADDVIDKVAFFYTSNKRG